jgi:hypothetical protein
LLELIGALGSISAAGRAMDMSYRRAWLLVDSLNQAFTPPVVATRPGGKADKRAELTPVRPRGDPALPGDGSGRPESGSARSAGIGERHQTRCGASPDARPQGRLDLTASAVAPAHGKPPA